MTIEMRAVPRADLHAWVETVESAFSSAVSEEYWRQIERTIEPDRVIGAYDGDRLVGGGAAFSFELTVPGRRSVKAAGVTNVGVLASHRRRGILRSMMTHQLADVRRRGEPVAVLWASESSIYQRFGYGIGTLAGTFDVATERAELLASQEADAGAARFVDLEEAARLFPAVYDVVCAATPGFLARSSTWWEAEVLPDPPHARRGHDKKFYVVLERGGVPVAYVMYRVKQEWGDLGTLAQLSIQELIAVDADATREMYRFVFGVDLIARVRNRFGAPDDPLLLMVSEPRRLALRVRDGLWLRVVDVQAALEQRGYAADGSVVLEVVDEFLPDAGGRWQVEVSHGSARLSKTDAPADLRLHASDLAAVYLGAFTFAQLGRAGRTRELTSGAHARADEMFATDIQPWSPQIF